MSKQHFITQADFERNYDTIHNKNKIYGYQVGLYLIQEYTARLFNVLLELTSMKFDMNVDLLFIHIQIVDANFKLTDIKVCEHGEYKSGHEIIEYDEDTHGQILSITDNDMFIPIIPYYNPVYMEGLNDFGITDAPFKQIATDILFFDCAHFLAEMAAFNIIYKRCMTLKEVKDLLFFKQKGQTTQVAMGLPLSNLEYN